MSDEWSLLCLDFDGVVCDSCEESSIVAWKHARQLWPELLPDDDWQAYLAPMRELRPAVHTGFEQTLQIRLLAEGSPPAEILAHWSDLRTSCLERWGIDRDDLIAGFGAIRDHWIAEDRADWIGHNGFYAPVVEALRATARPVYVITTKQARFCNLLLQAAGLEIAPERLFGLEAGCKADVLHRLLTLKDASLPRLRFVEDNPETLERIDSDPRLSSVDLYLADWGYNTAQMRRRAAANPRITVISLSDMAAFVAAP